MRVPCPCLRVCKPVCPETHAAAPGAHAPVPLHVLEHATGCIRRSALRLRAFRWRVCACVQILSGLLTGCSSTKHFACARLAGPYFLYFYSRGDMLVGTNKRHPISSRGRREFLHARTCTHRDRSAFLHAYMPACYPACCCHLLPPPATSAAAVCFAKTRPSCTPLLATLCCLVQQA